MEERILPMKSSAWYAFGLVVLFVGVGLFMLLGKSPSATPDVIDTTDSVQSVTLSIRNYNYYPDTVRVTAGKTVRVYLDSSVRGCYRYFTVPEFNIAKNIPTERDYVEFTPTKKGTYPFMCGMGMGRGTFVVE